MKNLMIAAAVAAALTAPVAHAQSKGGASADDVRALREQLQALTERLNRLEQSNQQLETSNAELKAQAGKSAEIQAQVQQVQADVDNTVDQLAKTRANAPEWAGRFALRGDLRYRHEEIRSDGDRKVAEGATAPVVNSLDRARDRIRLRFGGTFRVNDTLTVGMQLATGADDPRSSNQTLTGESSRKTIGVDQAFAAWQPNATWLVRAGKMPQPWTKPGTSLFFDNDINPEGVAVNFTHGLFFGGVSYMWLEERGPTVAGQGLGQTDASDPAMAHAQIGIKYPFTSTSSLTAGLTYFDHYAVEGRRAFFNAPAAAACTGANSGATANGNTTVVRPTPIGQTATCAAFSLYDYNVAEAFVQYDTIVFDTLPLMLYADFAQNDDAELDTAYSLGFTLGRASNAKTWELGAMYQQIEKDSLFGQWIDSDFGNGNTDSKGWVVRAGYAIKQNWTVNATYFRNELNNDVFSLTSPRDRQYDRLQLDTNFRF